MNEIIGMSNRALVIDLTTSSTKEIEITLEDRKMFLGAKGLALKFIAEMMDIKADPLSAENMLAIFTGPLLGTGAPSSARFAAVSKSPLTGIIASSSCGGNFGYALKTAGYDGIIVTGKAEKPTYIRITADNVKFLDASELWGKDTVETQEALEEKDAGIMVIGPAGENKVLYANIASGHRFFGRAGLGAVMGAKNLKAIVAVGGTYKVKPYNKKKFKKLQRKALKQLKSNAFTNKFYKNFGTNTNIRLSNETGLLPVRNFTKGKSAEAEKVAGETVVQHYEKKPSGCRFCTINCGHKGRFNDKIMQVPEYETNALFGPNLEIYDIEAIAEWNDLCNRLGLDTMSTAVTLGFVMEAGKKGHIKTMLEFGDKRGISETIEQIAYRKGFGDKLANGTRWLAKEYGGHEFAIHVKGLELAAYDPRGAFGQGLAYSVANRGGCHLTTAFFATESYFRFLSPYSTKGKAEFVWYLENLYAAINSLDMCIFTLYAFILEQFSVKYTPVPLLKIVMTHLPKFAMELLNLRLYYGFYEAVTGIKISASEFLKVGERITVLERYLNTILGISRKDDTLPERFLKEGRESDPQKYVVPLEQMLTKYYKIREYDDNGRPTAKLMKKLGLDRLIAEKPNISISKSD